MAAVAVALPVATWSTAGAQPGAAEVAGPDAAAPAVAAASVAREDTRCAQQDAGRSKHDEFASCIGVRARLASAPGLGEAARLEVTVVVDVDRPGALVDVELPPGWEFADAARAAVRSVRSAGGGGAAQRARLGADLRTGASQRFSYLVRPRVIGAAHIRVRVRAQVSRAFIDAGTADVFATVGRGAQPSRLGAAPAPTIADAAPVPSDARIAASATVRTVAGPADGAMVRTPVRLFSDDPVRKGAAAPSGQSCVSGGYFFVDQDGVTRPAWNQVYYVWDQDGISADDLIATGTVNSSGAYSACVANDDGELFDDGTQEIYVQFRTENSKWKVRDTAASNQVYRIATSVWDACNACDHSFGNLQAANSDLMRGMNAFDALNKLWQFVQGGSAACFDRNDTTCRQMVLNWTTTSTDGTYYSLGANDIHLAADDPNAPSATIHEGGHALMDDVYEDAFPPSPSCNPHTIEGATSTGCAWTEGFAEWLPAMVLNDPFFRWPSGGSLDLEAPTWDTFLWDDGDTVEGRVAGSMIDLSDSTQDVPWDDAAEGGSRTSRQYTTFVNTQSTTFSDFILVDRVAQGFPVTDVELGSLYQNTIDYGFREWLLSQIPLARGAPALPGVRYALTAGGGYWSAVGLRPQAASDDDLFLYSNRGQSVLAASSRAGAGVIDFVGIDRNGLDAATYYPQVRQLSGLTSHDIEFAQATSTLGNGVATRTLGAGDVVDIMDSGHASGVRVHYRLVPGATLDADLFLLRSASAGGVASRAQAAASSALSGLGAVESISYADDVTHWNGVVVVRRSGSGSYTLYRDTTAPTGTVLIGAGNPASINARAASLQVQVADADTGVQDMRVSVDGALDLELWEPFAATKLVTLPEGAGTKTVRVEVRNRAGMSAAFVDTIVYDPRPNLSASAAAGAISVRRGQSFALATTTRNSGPTGAGASTTRFFLSANATRDAGDTLLTGARAVPALAADAVDVGTVTVAVPATAPGGVLYLLACADEAGAVAEFSETDNCTAARDRVTVRGVDLRVSQLGAPPASRARGSSFALGMTTANIGLDPAVATVTRVYLSVDGIVGTGDVRLVGSQAVPALAGGAVSAATPAFAIPAATPRGVYRVIACADDTKLQDELYETNNCTVARTMITIT